MIAKLSDEETVADLTRQTHGVFEQKYVFGVVRLPTSR